MRKNNFTLKFLLSTPDPDAASFAACDDDAKLSIIIKARQRRLMLLLLLRFHKIKFLRLSIILKYFLIARLKPKPHTIDLITIIITRRTI